MHECSSESPEPGVGLTERFIDFNNTNRRSDDLMDYKAEKRPIFWYANPEDRDYAEESLDRSTIHWDVRFFDKYPALRRQLEQAPPLLVILDYEYPMRQDLDAIRALKLAYPSVPLLMMTFQRSVELTLWALRTRIWNFFIKPVSTHEIRDTISMLEHMVNYDGVDNKKRHVELPSSGVPDDVYGHPVKDDKRMILSALNTIATHLGERLSRKTLATTCRMTEEQFSRAFARAMGQSLRQYIKEQRLVRASELILLSENGIGNIAYARGFQDHSYFCRAFRKRFGVSPSDYRAKMQE